MLKLNSLEAFRRCICWHVWFSIVWRKWSISLCFCKIWRICLLLVIKLIFFDWLLHACKFQSCPEVSCKLDFLNNCIFSFRTHKDYLKSAVLSFCERQFFVSITVRWHVLRFNQRVNLAILKVDQLDRSERFRDIEWVKDGVIVWHGH